ncbi:MULTISPECIES: hypothetical protein [Halomonas]|uniref:Copper resistance protein D n=1 Tax=Halomonas ventosae TaxID=229007 RepID=A0A4R6I664_9GAMM|nr:hypothetical protein [Halomonas ventosae]TDO16827.1 hypothetical protein DFO68_101360 [Halomonas ventosae]
MIAMLLLLHLLGATVWTGGHLVLAATILPRVLKGRDVAAPFTGSRRATSASACRRWRYR